MTMVSGKHLSRYEIRSKLGEGGMGEVYLALDTELDRTASGCRSHFAVDDLSRPFV